MNFDRQGRELMTSEEISRLKDDDCIIFITGERPVYDKKYPTQEMKEFKEAAKLGDYIPDICVKKTKSGEYITIKAEGEMIPLNETSVEYYRKKKKEGEHIQFFDVSEEEFLQMDFSGSEAEVSTEMLNQLKIRQTGEDADYEDTLQEAWDLSGSIFECLDRYYNRLSREQKEEILLGMEEGLMEEEVKRYFTLEVEDMRIHRRMLKYQKVHK